MKSFRLLICTVLAGALLACAGLGVPPADTYDKKVAAAYALVATVADGTTALVTAGKISKADAVNVKATADTAIAGIDAAKGMFETNPAAAQTKLTSTIAILTALQVYLAAHQGAPK